MQSTYEILDDKIRFTCQMLHVRILDRKGDRTFHLRAVEQDQSKIQPRSSFAARNTFERTDNAILYISRNAVVRILHMREAIRSLSERSIGTYCRYDHAVTSYRRVRRRQRLQKGSNVSIVYHSGREDRPVHLEPIGIVILDIHALHWTSCLQICMSRQ